MSAFLRDLLSRLRPKSPALAVQVSDEGVTLLEGDRQYARFTWVEVREVVTFKRDLGTYDDIRLAFRVDDGWVEIGEDAEGWPALSAAINRHFPATPPDWYETGMLPPFETCYRVLYERASPGAVPDEPP